MCLAIPGRLVSTWLDQGTPMGTIDVGGVRKDICLAFVPDLAVGEYAIVHVGFAISRIDEESARETLALFAEMGILADELATDVPDLGPSAARGSEAPS